MYVAAMILNKVSFGYLNGALFCSSKAGLVSSRYGQLPVFANAILSRSSLLMSKGFLEKLPNVATILHIESEQPPKNGVAFYCDGIV